MVADVKIPRDVPELLDLIDNDIEHVRKLALSNAAGMGQHFENQWQTLYTFKVNHLDWIRAGYQITPAVRDDGARVEVVARAIFDIEEGAIQQWDDLPDLTPLGSMILTGKDRYRRLATAAIDAADAVVGAGREEDHGSR